MTPSERFVEANRLRHHLVEWDGGGATTVLCLHGFLDQAWSFQWFAEALGGDYHVVAADLRGHGQSEWVGRGGFYYSLDSVLDVAALAPKVRRDRLVVVGHSFGGITALRYAGAVPDGLDALVVAEGFGLPDGAPEEAPTRAAATAYGLAALEAKTPRPVPDLEAVAARIRAAAPRVSEVRSRALAPHAARAVDGGFVFRFDPLLRVPGPLPFSAPQLEAYCRRIAVPTLLVEGALSEFGRAYAAERGGWIGGSRRVTVKGAGHMMHVENPTGLAEAVGAFLREVRHES